MFYRIAGRSAAAIDGPTEYSLYPSNVSAKLAPKNPQKAAEKIKKIIYDSMSSRVELSVIEGSINKKKISRQARNDIDGSNFSLLATHFGGAVIIDANDIGRNILGNATDKPNSFFEQVMRDNPMGQGSEGTPVVIVV